MSPVFKATAGLSRRAAVLAASALLLGWVVGLQAAERPPALALIIDDLGFRLIEDQAILALDPRISVAIIPGAPQARRLAEQARAQQRVVLVHLPLAQEPHGECDMPPCPRREWSAERMRRHLAWAFDQVPGALGLNNHQGSQFTADRAATRRLLEGLKLYSRKQPVAPFVIDSRTTPDSQLEDLAAAAGFGSAKRDIFLDHERSAEAMESAWQTAIALSRRQGHAVVIAHPHPETIAFLSQALGALESAGIELVPITRVLSEAAPLRPRMGHPAANAAYRSPIYPPGP